MEVTHLKRNKFAPNPAHALGGYSNRYFRNRATGDIILQAQTRASGSGTCRRAARGFCYVSTDDGAVGTQRHDALRELPGYASHGGSSSDVSL